MNLLLTGAPSLIAAAGGGEGHGIGFRIFIYSGIVLATMLVVLAAARSGLGQRVFKNPITQAGEQLYLFIENLCIGVIGPHGRKYIPFIFGIWLYIFLSNLLGLVLPFTPTADFSLNLGISIITILYVQWEGIRANGVLGHFRHFAGPKLGGILVLVSLLIFGIEIISETMKMLSLSLRLFANIEGGHIVKEGLDHIMPLPGVDGAYFPLSAIILPIKFLAAIIQALVWSLLTCVYLSLVTHHEHEHSNNQEEHQGEYGHHEPHLATTPA
ncbi:MAG TPA: F0F1 ATP synthase subunit A [Fimbriimonas sp.]